MKKRSDESHEENGEGFKKSKIISGLDAREAIAMSKYESKSKILTKIRAAIEKALSETLLTVETKRVCVEDAVFIISRVMQLKTNCVVDLKSSNGVLMKHLLPNLEHKYPIEQLRILMHYVFQVAAQCLCERPEYLIQLQNDPRRNSVIITHIGYIVQAIREAYPDMPNNLGRDPKINCIILKHYLSKASHNALRFCNEIEQREDEREDEQTETD